MKQTRGARIVGFLRKTYSRIDGVVFLFIFALLVLLFVVAREGKPAEYALLVASACALSGALLGFLFAVPKRKRAGDAAAAPAVSPGAGGESGKGTVHYESNTSLEEISDWLTKIIVGVGLVQAQEIAAALGRAGGAVGTGVFRQPAGAPAAEVIGVATILTFAVLGFLAAFLWFRQNLMIAWTQSQEEANAVSQERMSAAPAERVQSESPASLPETPIEAPALKLLEAAAGPETAALREKVARKFEQMRSNAQHPADWAKGMFGGQSSQPTPLRSLTASVQPVSGDRRFEVVLTITSDPPATGNVVFFLPKTLEDVTPVVPLDARGVATLTLYCLRAFTAGALIGDGSTELELDLSQLQDAPAAFRGN